MINLGVNTVLFKKYTLSEAAECISKAGYDGMELSAIGGMCEHLFLDGWKEQKAYIQETAEKFNLKLLSMEVASLDEARLLKAFEAGAEIGIPIINVGSGGKANEEETLLASIEKLNKMSALAEQFGVTLCCKAHVGASIFNSATTLFAIKNISSKNFGIDMDPSHIIRAGEKPEEALPQVISNVKHIHIRDCKGPGPSPGEPALQACGRGDINLYGYFKAMVDGKYNGPVCLEVIGPELDMVSASIIAAESYGYMNAYLKLLNAR